MACARPSLTRVSNRGKRRFKAPGRPSRARTIAPVKSISCRSRPPGTGAHTPTVRELKGMGCDHGMLLGLSTLALHLQGFFGLCAPSPHCFMSQHQAVQGEGGTKRLRTATHVQKGLAQARPSPCLFPLSGANPGRAGGHKACVRRRSRYGGCVPRPAGLITLRASLF